MVRILVFMSDKETLNFEDLLKELPRDRFPKNDGYFHSEKIAVLN